MVKNVLPGELGHHVGVGVVPASRSPPYLRLILRHPTHLRTDRLGRQSLTAPLENGLRAETLSEICDLLRGAHINPVQDRGPHRPGSLVRQCEARANPTHANARKALVSDPLGQLATDLNEVL